MKMIPSHVYRFPSSAEEKVFEILRSPALEGYALHSLNVSSHPWKPWAEIDFICIRPFGLLAIEVKGGHISRHEGQWFTNQTPLKESPFDQVRDAVYELSRAADFHGASFGWAVIFPDSQPVPETPEHPAQMQAAYNDCSNVQSFRKWLDGVEDYWIEKVGRHQSIDSRTMSTLLKSLRPDFDAAVPLGTRSEQLNKQIKQFTEEQFTRLDDIQENDQILCRGGAGTGKTFLAIEVAKRESARDCRVLVVARSQPLVEWIADQLAIKHVTTLAADQLESGFDGQPFDVLVVDEGQDLLNLRLIGQLDRMLQGGFEKGRWRWFMDDQNQAGLHDDIDPEAIELLNDRGVTLQRLRVNCRNTRQIVEFTQYTTGADIGEARLQGGGKVPEFEFVTEQSEFDALQARLDLWHRKDEISLDRIVVLVCDDKAVDRVRQAVGAEVRVESVLAFKGLESEFVALVGIPPQIGALNQSAPEIYTGMTRARIELWVSVPASLEQEWQDIRTENARRKIEMQLGGINQ